MKVYCVTQQRPPFGKPDEWRSWEKKSQKMQVYEALFNSKDGLTRPEITAKIGLAADRISFYLSDLRRSGCIAIKGTPIDMSLLSKEEAALYAMQALENALAAKIREQPERIVAGRSTRATDAQNTAFVKYQKCKALALRGVGGEAAVAMRMSLLELVKLVF